MKSPIAAHKLRSTSAFTLIELLVVVAIIGVVAMLAMNAFARMRVSGWQHQSLSNLRQIGAAIHLFTGENEGRFPQTSHTEDQASWIFTLRPYLDQVDEVRICPADPRGDERRKEGLSSYVLNEYICVPKRDPFGRITEDFTNIALLPKPERTITVFIGADALEVGISSDHTHSRNWRSWRAVCNDIQPDRFRLGAADKENMQGTSLYLFADGHVEPQPASWLRTEIDAKRNPAIPPQ